MVTADPLHPPRLETAAHGPCSVRSAVLLVSYNRYPTTRAAIADLHEAGNALDDACLTIFLLDDASPDHTGDLIKAEWPDVRVMHGDGDLFWNRGMHRLVEHARADASFDGLLFMNDDVRLLPGAVAAALRLFRSKGAGKGTAVLVGAMRDPVDGLTSYSGFRRLGADPLRVERLDPVAAVLPCDTASGNFLLFPRRVIESVGNVDAIFRHAVGDMDICYRARAAGFEVLLLPSYVGECARNPLMERSLRDRPFRDRLRFLLGPKGDLAGRVRFVFRHASPSVALGRSIRLTVSYLVALLAPELYLRRARIG